VVEILEHSARRTHLVLFMDGTFEFERKYEPLPERTSPYKGDIRVPNRTRKSIDAEVDFPWWGLQAN